MFCLRHWNSALYDVLPKTLLFPLHIHHQHVYNVYVVNRSAKYYCHLYSNVLVRKGKTIPEEVPSQNHWYFIHYAIYQEVQIMVCPHLDYSSLDLGCGRRRR